jgi:transposase
MKIKNKVKELKVKELKTLGYSISKIAKMLNISYAHCKNLYNQE